jgi:hypothetical protein
MKELAGAIRVSPELQDTRKKIALARILAP